MISVEFHESDGVFGFQRGGETTGRYLVLFEEGAAKAGIKALRDATGTNVVSATADGNELGGEDTVVFDKLGVAVVSAPPQQIQQAGASTQGSRAIRAVEPERVVYALEANPFAPALPGGADGVAPAPTPQLPVAEGMHSAEYLRGYRDAVLNLTAPAGSVAAGAAAGVGVAAVVDESQATWGLQAVKAVNSCRSGRGIGVAVLDTGFDASHPDFADRNVTTQSFVQGEAADDGHGHGTHCIGTATGSKCPTKQPRYGVAHEADIFAGKVLSNAGSGTDSQILAGIDWAVSNRCAVISMSLGSPTVPGEPFSEVFENVARRASQAGSLVIAAAGNESQRPSEIKPVGHPANCPSIMAVAAVDVRMRIAPFSNRGIDPGGGQVDVAGPGVDVYSSWPLPTTNRRISGTSMATPHAAGIAALLAEANPQERGSALGRLLTATARRLPNLPSADVGAGLVQAP